MWLHVELDQFPKTASGPQVHQYEGTEKYNFPLTTLWLSLSVSEGTSK